MSDTSGRPLRAVLWDMDGTLVDTEPYWIASEFDIVERYGNGAWSHEHGLALVGKDLRDSAAYIREVGAMPFEIDEMGKDALSARTPIGEVGLKKGSKISYVFDFGDEWRLALRVVDAWPAGDESYPMLVGAEGTPLPQYPDLDEDE